MQGFFRAAFRPWRGGRGRAALERGWPRASRPHRQCLSALRAVRANTCTCGDRGSSGTARAASRGSSKARCSTRRPSTPAPPIGQQERSTPDERKHEHRSTAPSGPTRNAWRDKIGRHAKRLGGAMNAPSRGTEEVSPSARHRVAPESAGPSRRRLRAGQLDGRTLPASRAARASTRRTTRRRSPRHPGAGVSAYKISSSIGRRARAMRPDRRGVVAPSTRTRRIASRAAASEWGNWAALCDDAGSASSSTGAS